MLCTYRVQGTDIVTPVIHGLLPKKLRGMLKKVVIQSLFFVLNCCRFELFKI
jgi:hypothetical protein